MRGDPQLVGLLGQSFQVHGIDGAVYSLISHEEAAVNSRFAFLDGPRPCPNKPHVWAQGEQPIAITCWSHEGSYLSELEVFTPDARLLVRPGVRRRVGCGWRWTATA